MTVPYRPGRTYTDEERRVLTDAAVYLYAQGLSLRQVGAWIGRDASAVLHLLRRAGVERRPEGGSEKAPAPPKRRSNWQRGYLDVTDGIERPLSEAARENGVSPELVASRTQNGWPRAMAAIVPPASTYRVVRVDACLSGYYPKRRALRRVTAVAFAGTAALHASQWSTGRDEKTGGREHLSATPQGERCRIHARLFVDTV